MVTIKDLLTEEEIVYRVRDIQKPEESKFKQASRFGLKVSMKKQGKDTMVTLKGTKKLLRDFDRIARGKSSYGDPSTVKHFDEGVEMIEENVINKMKQIVSKKQAMKIDGVMVDMFTASAVTQIYDKVNDANKKKMEKMKPTQLANAAMKLMQRNSVEESVIVEVTDKEINAMKQLSKDAEKIKKNYQKIVNMGDKELRNKKYNKEYEDILKMSQSVLSLIGKLSNQKMINKESLEEDGHNDVESMKNKVKTAMSALQKMNQELGKLGDEDSLPTWWTNKVAVAVDKLDGMADYIDTQVESIEEAVSPAQQAAIAISKKEKGEKPKTENRARRDAMRGMSRDKDFQDKDDVDIKATDDDRKVADKNPIIQLRRIADLPRGGEMEFKDGKKKKISQTDAKMALKGFNVMRKPKDKENFSKNAGASHTSLKKILQIVGRRK